MGARAGHRARWIVVSVLVMAWFGSLLFDVGGSLTNLLLVLAAVVLFYELLAVDRTPG